VLTARFCDGRSANSGHPLKSPGSMNFDYGTVKQNYTNSPCARGADVPAQR